MSWFAHLFPTCQEMSRLLSDTMDRRLPWHVRTRIRIHLQMCEVCKSYHHQLRLLRSLLLRNPAQHSERESTLQPGLSVKAKERIRRALDSYRS
ncbi:MAG: zf-HC2 domain-containing protein [Nitrospirae bacterium]|nr:zf-HC2 domain-containing protein [Nitrospirota bacterium]